jgi:hypothetical protein
MVARILIDRARTKISRIGYRKVSVVSVRLRCYYDDGV